MDTATIIGMSVGSACNMARQILVEHGLAGTRIHSVTGRADMDPFYPSAPYLAGNQRVTIELIYEQPPVPVDLQP